MFAQYLPEPEPEPEHSLKKIGVIGWEAKFWFKIRGIGGENVTFDLSVSALKAGFATKKKNDKND